MKKIKNILLAFLCLSLVAILSVAGTIAYLQDEDSDVNVMTMGNVKIEQIEQEWNDDKTELVEFTQLKPLYPYVGTFGWENESEDKGAYRRFTMENVVDKYVSVKNTGKSDAYVRTIIALEMGNFTYQEFKQIGISNNAENGAEFKFPGAWEWTENYETTIDGKKYNIMVAVHKDPLEPGQTTIPSLLQVYLAKEATNEDVEKLDGNGNGRYDILVKSQAVQTKGFADANTALNVAFGEANKENELEVASWFAGMKLELNSNEVSDEKNYGYTINQDTTINLTEDTTTPYLESIGTDVTINGNEKGLTSGSAEHYGIITKNGGNTVINDITINSSGGGISSSDGSKVVVNNVKLDINTTSTSGRYLFYAEGVGSEIVINSGNFDFNKTQNQKRAYIYAGEGTTVYVKGGKFGTASSRSGYTAGILGPGNVIITGGTFGFNPSNWVADGYKVISEKDANNVTWYTVVAE